MLLVWLLVWLCAGAPGIHEWNGWAVSLLVVLGLCLIEVVRPTR